MKLCLDTNAYSAFKKGQPNAIEVLEEADHIFIPMVVVGELYAGFELGSRFKENERGLLDFLNEPGVEAVPVDRSIAERYGHLIKQLTLNGTPIPTNDVWIAATVFETGSKL